MKTTEECYNVISAEETAQTGLAGLAPANDTAARFIADLLSSTSSMAPHRLQKWVVARVMSMLTLLWDRAKAEQRQIADESEVNTDAWLRGWMKRWQAGDSLTFVGNIPGYATVDASKQLIKFCAARTLRRRLRIMVAKDDGAGLPVPLTATELAEAQAFATRIAPPGTVPLLDTSGPDKLKLNGTVYYDGQLSLGAFTAAFEAAVQEVGKDLAEGGYLQVLAIVDAMQAVPGFRNWRPVSYQARPAGAVDYATFTMRYAAEAAAVQADFSVSDLTYVAE